MEAAKKARDEVAAELHKLELQFEVKRAELRTLDVQLAKQDNASATDLAAPNVEDNAFWQSTNTADGYDGAAQDLARTSNSFVRQLDGVWRTSQNKISRISGTILSWPEGNQTQVTLSGGDVLFMEHMGKIYKASLEEGGSRLAWSDGDVWIRVPEEEMANLRMCPKGHELQALTVPPLMMHKESDFARCDSCSIRLRPALLRGEDVKCCRPCNFDLCADCHPVWPLSQAQQEARQVKQFLQEVDEIPAVIDEDTLYKIRVLGSTTAYVKAHRECMLAAVKKTGYALEFAAPDLQADREIVLAAVTICGPEILVCAKGGLQRDPVFLKAAGLHEEAKREADRQAKQAAAHEADRQAMLAVKDAISSLAQLCFGPLEKFGSGGTREGIYVGVLGPPRRKKFSLHVWSSERDYLQDEPPAELIDLLRVSALQPDPRRPDVFMISYIDKDKHRQKAEFNCIDRGRDAWVETLNILITKIHKLQGEKKKGSSEHGNELSLSGTVSNHPTRS
eukprot:CAMPEP_0172828808 /NCGR_PEP_ID=MMETSP1075-20121228/21087_1 /TAXON_ID=2916 /ORGANISM="Ceratium fusus, Strain PA161109" /LENGTH=506 /DNA_ID=CAMNT_0013670849 /DNA_START=70 /DNA_END=1593 /DNA_ORIENTATION=-